MKRVILCGLVLLLVAGGALQSWLPSVTSAQGETSPWNIVQVDPNVGFSSYPSLAFDPQGKPAIAYDSAEGYELRYAHFNGTAWDITVVQSGSTCYTMPSLAFDPQGNLAIAYCFCSGDENGDLYYAHFNGTTWDIEPVDTEGNVGSYPSLAFDPRGNPAISYYDFTHQDLKYAHFNGTAWDITTVDSEGDVGACDSLAFDPQGNPGISYIDTTRACLKYAHFDGASWDIVEMDREVLSWGDPSCFGTSLAFDPQGRPAISYRDSPHLDLRYAHFNGTTWDITSVDKEGDVGLYPSLAFDPQGNPAISCWDRANGVIKFARFNGTAWDTEIVAEGGEGTSLAFDPQGNVGISYFDLRNLSLKYAYKEISYPSKQEVTQLLPEVHWRVIGVDCNPYTRWEADSVMKFTRNVESLAEYENRDAWIVNPYGWENSQWTTRWDPSTRREVWSSSETESFLPEYLPADITLKVGGRVVLNDYEFSVLERVPWRLPTGRPRKGERYAWLLSNRESAVFDYGDGEYSVVEPEGCLVKYDTELGVLVESYERHKLYDGDKFLFDFVRYTYITYPNDLAFKGPQVELSQASCDFSQPLYTETEPKPENYAIGTGFHIYCQNRPETGKPNNVSCRPEASQDVIVKVLTDHPDKLTIKYYAGPAHEQQELEGCRNKLECTVPYSLWRKIDWTYVDVVVRDINGNEERWGTVIKPASRNRAPEWQPGYPAFVTDSDCVYGKITFKALAQDPDGDALSYKWYLDDPPYILGPKKLRHIPELDDRTTWDWSLNSPPSLDYTGKVKVVVSDSQGAAIEKTLEPPRRCRPFILLAPQAGEEVSKSLNWKAFVHLDPCGGFRSPAKLQLELEEWHPSVPLEPYSHTKINLTESIEPSPRQDLIFDEDLDLTECKDEYGQACARYENAYTATFRLIDEQGRTLTLADEATKAVIPLEETVELIFKTGEVRGNVITLVDFLSSFTGEMEQVSACPDVYKALKKEQPDEESLQVALRKGFIDCSKSLFSGRWVDKAKLMDALCDVIMEELQGNPICAASKEAQVYFDATNEELPIPSKYATSEMALNLWGCANAIICNVINWKWGSTKAIMEESGKDLDLHAIDRFGRHVGMNYKTGEYEIDIPRAAASGDVQGGREFISLPTQFGAHFYVDARDAEEDKETYTLTIVYEAAGKTTFSSPITQNIKKGEKLEHKYRIEYGAEATSISVESGSPLVYGNGLCDPGETPRSAPIDCDVSPPVIKDLRVPKAVIAGEPVTIEVDISDDGNILLAFAEIRDPNRITRHTVLLGYFPDSKSYKGVWDTSQVTEEGPYVVDIFAFDEAENKTALTETATVRVTGARKIEPGTARAKVYVSSGRRKDFRGQAGGSSCCGCVVEHRGTLPPDFPRGYVRAVTFYLTASHSDSYYTRVKKGPTKLRLVLGGRESVATSQEVSPGAELPVDVPWLITFKFDPPVEAGPGTPWELLDGDDEIYSNVLLHSSNLDEEGLPGTSETKECQYAAVKDAWYSVRFELVPGPEEVEATPTSISEAAPTPSPVKPEIGKVTPSPPVKATPVPGEAKGGGIPRLWLLGSGVLLLIVLAKIVRVLRR